MVCIIMGIVATPSADTQVTMGRDQAEVVSVYRWSQGQVSLYNELTKPQEGVIAYCIA